MLLTELLFHCLRFMCFLFKSTVSFCCSVCLPVMCLVTINHYGNRIGLPPGEIRTTTPTRLNLVAVVTQCYVSFLLQSNTHDNVCHKTVRNLPRARTPTHTDAQTHTHAHTYIHTYRYTRRHRPTQTQVNTHTHTHAPQTPPNTHAHSVIVITQQVGDSAR